ncbi:MAG: T9SS type A sorting domain-containing protein [Bacteroidales bacterium]|nr:T9SS type A sorting domain-containing protein [Bacteroidales bacterium]
MKTHISRLVAVAVLVTAWSACLQAQTKAYYVSYAYDADGNRVSRTVWLGNDREDRSQSDTAAVAHYTDCIDECEISIYPNPTSGRVNVGMTSPTEEDIAFTAALFSPSGVLITRREAGTFPAEFDLSGLPPGVYMLELRLGDETRTWKIIKR